MSISQSRLFLIFEVEVEDDVDPEVQTSVGLKVNALPDHDVEVEVDLAVEVDASFAIEIDADLDGVSLGYCIHEERLFEFFLTNSHLPTRLSQYSCSHDHNQCLSETHQSFFNVHLNQILLMHRLLLK